MKTNGLLVLLASLPFTLSAPRISGSDNEVHAVADWTTTTTISATLSYTYTTTYKVTEPTITATTTTSSSISKPTYTATELYAVRPGAPFHMMPFQAAGNVFRLGTGNAAYCPTFAQKTGACEQQSNITGVNDCSLSVNVPGGQGIYLAPDGELKYTTPHSQYMVPGSIICPLSYTPVRDSDATEVMIAGFGATGFMACPMLSTTSSEAKQQWQILANTLNASTPMRNRNSSSPCWPFEAVGIEKQMSHAFAAYEYA